MCVCVCVCMCVCVCVCVCVCGKSILHGAMGCRIDLSWGGPIEVFLVPTRALRLV